MHSTAKKTFRFANCVRNNEQKRQKRERERERREAVREVEK